MQPGHEEVLLAPEELLSAPEEFSSAPEELSSAPELEELLLDESSLLFLAHEMMVRLKREMRIMHKILFIFLFTSNERK